MEKAIKPPQRRPGTYAAYKRIIDDKLIPAFGAMRLQQLKALDIERYYADAVKLSQSTFATPRACSGITWPAPTASASSSEKVQS